MKHTAKANEIITELKAMYSFVVHGEMSPLLLTFLSHFIWRVHAPSVCRNVL